MLKIENYEVMGWKHVIRGMRNPKNSWGLSDSGYGCEDKMCGDCGFKPDWCGNVNHEVIGPNDHKLMSSLAKGGPVHAKYRRMITVYLDITAPLYWWKEFDTYKVGTVANSCSTMHKIHDKEFESSDFSFEHLQLWNKMCPFNQVLDALNFYRDIYLNGGDVEWDDGRVSHFAPKNKNIWWQMIQLLPTSYNQKRTVMLNYEVLHNMYFSRKDHKLDEWHTLCDWIKTLPYSELITMEESV